MSTQAKIIFQINIPHSGQYRIFITNFH